eukprot:4972345-Prymnesium_polylepis.1
MPPRSDPRSDLPRRNKGATAVRRATGPKLHLADDDSESSVDSDVERLAAESVDKRRQQLIDQKVSAAREEAVKQAEEATVRAVEEVRAEGRREQAALAHQHDEAAAMQAKALRQADSRTEAAAAAVRKLEVQLTELEKKRQQLADQLLDERQERRDGESGLEARL